MKAVAIFVAVFFLTAHVSIAKKFTVCELVHALKSHGIPSSEFKQWVCIAEHESSLNSAARGGPNSDGSYDNGIFQINNRYWCKDGAVGGECNAKCSSFRDDNLSDDIKCVKHIKSVQGFKAWSTWKYCSGTNLPSVAGC